MKANLKKAGILISSTAAVITFLKILGLLNSSIAVSIFFPFGILLYFLSYIFVKPFWKGMPPNGT